MFLMFHSCEKSILRKNLVLSIEKFPSLVLPRNAIILQHLIIQFPRYHLSSGHLLEVKTLHKWSWSLMRGGHLKIQMCPKI